MSGDLQAIQTALDQLRSGQLGVADFSAQTRQCAAQLGTLPPRYSEVLSQLLDRLESSALFSEESCSFSQRDLIDSVQTWVDKAAERLAAQERDV